MFSLEKKSDRWGSSNQQPSLATTVLHRANAAELKHRRDSIHGTDYIANYFFLNLRVSKAKIENLKWWISGDIIPPTFRKFVTFLVQKLKILGKKNWLVVSTLTANFCYILIS